MVKIDIISGFLGAGKTTLIKKLFESSLKDERVVLIENEFGEIGIDGSFLKESGIQIKEINSGCICCSLVGDFEASIKELISLYVPERIIIEPSGVGKLSDIIKAVKDVDADLEINVVTCVVDAKKLKIQLKNFGEFLHNQIEYANTIILAKVDTVNEAKIEEDLALIREINDHANIVTTNINELDSEYILSVLQQSTSLTDKMIKELEEEHEHHHHHDNDEECCCHDHDHEHHHHDHDEECECHDHEHHHHDHDEECCCHDHEHEHEHEHEHHHHDGECCCGHHHHHADEIFTSWGMETVKAISHDELVSFLDELTSSEDIGMILRSKGILKAKDNDSWYYFDYVAGDYQIRLGNPDSIGRIVVIGSKIDTHKIEELYNEKVK